jgi:hypothetical protein
MIEKMKNYKVLLPLMLADENQKSYGTYTDKDGMKWLWIDSVSNMGDAEDCRE